MKFVKLTILLSTLVISSSVYAAGMVPETSLLLVSENEHGASMDVTNTDNEPALLYVQVKDLPDDPLPGLIVTQPVVRVEAGKVQRVRFVLKPSATPLKTEHLKRVIFTTIPELAENKIKVGFKQDLPVIIRPADLPYIDAPWKDLVWTRSGNIIKAKNDTPYIIRLEQKVMLLPSGTKIGIPQPYILPKTTIQAKLPINYTQNDNSVEIYPATRYGYAEGKFNSKLN
ncbi:fimbria/pilus chaperone family protein [Citrobacter portucalensis]|uniref:fimbria/pilus chaperone family protein n=1 Tax=Citrobacter portucalensis TaxID=1639133 RepID=UPI00254EFA38|nr:fimbria/pilus chaperone family protein [Citrobacter portucalensis]